MADPLVGVLHDEIDLALREFEDWLTDELSCRCSRQQFWEALAARVLAIQEQAGPPLHIYVFTRVQRMVALRGLIPPEHLVASWAELPSPGTDGPDTTRR